jgi:hypothetical protein
MLEQRHPTVIPTDIRNSGLPPDFDLRPVGGATSGFFGVSGGRVEVIFLVEVISPSNSSGTSCLRDDSADHHTSCPPLSDNESDLDRPRIVNQ